jgi:hypothetical protein
MLFISNLRLSHTDTHINVKVKLALEQFMKAQRGSRGTALLFL